MCSIWRKPVPLMSAGVLNLIRNFESIPLGCSFTMVLFFLSRCWPLSLINVMTESNCSDVTLETKKFFSMISCAVGVTLEFCATRPIADPISTVRSQRYFILHLLPEQRPGQSMSLHDHQK